MCLPSTLSTTKVWVMSKPFPCATLECLLKQACWRTAEVWGVLWAYTVCYLFQYCDQHISKWSQCEVWIHTKNFINMKDTVSCPPKSHFSTLAPAGSACLPLWRIRSHIHLFPPSRGARTWACTPLQVSGNGGEVSWDGGTSWKEWFPDKSDRHHHPWLQWTPWLRCRGCGSISVAVTGRPRQPQRSRPQPWHRWMARTP